MDRNRQIILCSAVTPHCPPRPSTAADARRAISFLPQRVSFPDSLTGREVLEFYRQLRGIAPGRSDAV
ncbi:MAG: hypothetical protein ACXWHG_14780, partial [Thermoanaerobaculia bacterium]